MKRRTSGGADVRKTCPHLIRGKVRHMQQDAMARDRTGRTNRNIIGDRKILHDARRQRAEVESSPMSNARRHFE